MKRRPRRTSQEEESQASFPCCRRGRPSALQVLHLRSSLTRLPPSSRPGPRLTPPGSRCVTGRASGSPSCPSPHGPGAVLNPAGRKAQPRKQASDPKGGLPSLAAAWKAPGRCLTAGSMGLSEQRGHRWAQGVASFWVWKACHTSEPGVLLTQFALICSLGWDGLPSVPRVTPAPRTPAAPGHSPRGPAGTRDCGLTGRSCGEKRSPEAGRVASR